MQTWIDLKFADGEYTFKLGLGQIAEIERKCDAGIGAIYARTLRGRYGFDAQAVDPMLAEYRLTDLVEIIRQGLIGGGSGMVNGQPVKVSSIRANDLIDSYVLGVGNTRQALVESWAIAASVLMALIEGYSPPKAGPAVEPAT